MFEKGIDHAKGCKKHMPKKKYGIPTEVSTRRSNVESIHKIRMEMELGCHGCAFENTPYCFYKEEKNDSL